MATLKASGVHAVAYGLVTKGNGDAFITEEKHMSLSTGGGQAGQGYPACVYIKDKGGVAVDSKGKSAGKGPLIQIEKSATLAVAQDQYLFQPIVFPASGGGALNMTKDLSPTLKAVNYKDPYCVLVEPIGVDMYNQAITGGVTMTMSAKASDPHHVPCVIEPIGVDVYNGYTTGGVTCTLTTGITDTGSCPKVLVPTLSIDMGGGKSRVSCSRELSPTLCASNDGAPAVCYGISGVYSNAMLSSNPNSGIYEATTSRTLDMNGGNPNCNQGGIVIVEQASIHDSAE